MNKLMPYIIISVKPSGKELCTPVGIRCIIDVSEFADALKRPGYYLFDSPFSEKFFFNSKELAARLERIFRQ